MDLFHSRFVTLLNQVHLPEVYALGIFMSNLKPNVGQYLRLFEPQTLVQAYLLARKVERILIGPSKKTLVLENEIGQFRPLLTTTEGHQFSSGFNG